MKKIILTALLGIPVMSIAQNNKFNLNAKVGETSQPAKAYLIYMQGDKQVIDSAAISNGAFKFSEEISNPIMAALVLDHQGVGLRKLGRTADVLQLFMENGQVQLAAKDSVKKATITGSKINTEYDSYKKYTDVPLQKMMAINAEYVAADATKKQDKDFSSSINTRYNQASEERKVLQSQYIDKNKNSFVSLAVLTELAGQDIDVSKIEPVFKSLSATVQNSQSGVQFSKLIDIARATSIGSMAPVFTQNDVNDKPVSLADFHGKYVLLDFWASWCGPCRAENPNVVKAYNQYKDKNFTVLGVSLDQPGKKDKWLAAIAADGLAWTQVSDLKFWSNDVAKQYHIRSIPQNFLIDPTGKIVGKNLRGEELDKKLKEVFGSL